jgi:hypothetical protein
MDTKVFAAVVNNHWHGAAGWVPHFCPCLVGDCASQPSVGLDEVFDCIKGFDVSRVAQPLIRMRHAALLS